MRLAWLATMPMRDSRTHDRVRERLIPDDVSTYVTALFPMGSLTRRTCHLLGNCAAPRNALVSRSFLADDERL